MGIGATAQYHHRLATRPQWQRAQSHQTGPPAVSSQGVTTPAQTGPWGAPPRHIRGHSTHTGMGAEGCAPIFTVLTGAGALRCGGISFPTGEENAAGFFFAGRGAAGAGAAGLGATAFGLHHQHKMQLERNERIVECKTRRTHTTTAGG